jgi:hypothetical protein
MTDQQINSYISEFKQYKNEIMSNVNECKDKSNKNLVGTVYGHYQSLKEFWYNKDDKTGYIFVNGVKIDVTNYL